MMITITIFFVSFMQDEKELCLATAQFEDFVLQFMDRWVTLYFIDFEGTFGEYMHDGFL